MNLTWVLKVFPGPPATYTNVLMYAGQWQKYRTFTVTETQSSFNERTWTKIFIWIPDIRVNKDLRVTCNTFGINFLLSFFSIYDSFAKYVWKTRYSRYFVEAFLFSSSTTTRLKYRKLYYVIHLACHDICSEQMQEWLTEQISAIHGLANSKYYYSKQISTSWQLPSYFLVC